MKHWPRCFEPHTLSKDRPGCFLSIILYDLPMQWNTYSIHCVNEVKADHNLVETLLKSNDYLRTMLEQSEIDTSIDTVIDAEGESLIAELLKVGKSSAGEHANSATASNTTELAMTQENNPNNSPEQALAEHVSKEKSWFLFIRYHADLFRMGFDPKTFLDYLASMGQLQAVYTHFTMPASFPQFDPTSCQMWQEIILLSEQNEEKYALPLISS